MSPKLDRLSRDVPYDEVIFTEGRVDDFDIEPDGGDELAKGAEVEAVEEGGLSRRVETDEEDLAVSVAIVGWESVI